MDGHCRACGACLCVEIRVVDTVIPCKIVHRDQEGGQVDQMFKVGTGGLQVAAHVLDHGFGLGLDVELHAAVIMNNYTIMRVIGPARRCSAQENQVTDDSAVGVGAKRFGSVTQNNWFGLN